MNLGDREFSRLGVHYWKLDWDFKDSESIVVMGRHTSSEFVVSRPSTETRRRSRPAAVAAAVVVDSEAVAAEAIDLELDEQLRLMNDPFIGDGDDEPDDDMQGWSLHDNDMVNQYEEHEVRAVRASPSMAPTPTPDSANHTDEFGLLQECSLDDRRLGVIPSLVQKVHREGRWLP